MTGTMKYYRHPFLFYFLATLIPWVFWFSAGYVSHLTPEKAFYNGLIEYITSAPVMAMVWEGANAVAAVRQTMGATRPTEAAPGSA